MKTLSNADEHQIKIKVKAEHIDTLGHVNNITYLRWVQEISAAHWKNNTDKEMQHTYLWVVLRHEIDYYKAAFAGDELIAITRVERFEGVKSIRKVEFYKDDILVVKSLTIWGLLNAENGRPLRVPEKIQELFIKN